MQKIKLFLRLIVFVSILGSPFLAQAMPPGTLLYRTSSNGKMYGYSDDPIIYAEKGIVKNVYSGHVAIYLGQENGIDYIAEALSGGIVKTPAQYFINEASNEKFLGAKIPKNLSPLQQAKVIALARSLLDKKLKYDFDFKKQKGPGSGEWTCVGFTEKIYESANISNPNNLGALEYDPAYYAIDITADGYDNTTMYNERGDCFSTDYEFSKIKRYKDLLIPAPELIGFDAGLEYEGERYIFFPYTQFLQTTLEDVEVDINLSSNFPDSEIRGKASTIGLVLRWSLINNPISSIKNLARQAKELALTIKDKIFTPTPETKITLSEPNLKTSVPKTTTKKVATIKKTTAKKTSTKTAAKKATVKKTATPKVTNQKVVRKDENNSQVYNQPLTDKNVSPTINKPSVKATTKVVSSTPVTKSPEVHQASAYISHPTVNVNTQTSSQNSPIVNNPVTSNPATENTNNNAEGTNDNLEPDWPKLALISKIYATGDNDWLELYNPTEHDFDLALAEYRLEKAKTANDPSLMMRLGNPEDGLYPGGTTIKSKGYYLIARNEANDYYKSKAQAIALRDEFSWSDSGYTIYLGTGAISSSTDEDIIEAVGFGQDATYFQGASPALAITNNYILNRVATSGDNFLDFNLIASDDPNIVWPSPTSSQATSSEASSTIGLFIPPTPIESFGLRDLWHFDECYGEGKWAVGRFDCARELGLNYPSISADLSPAINLNSFSVSFYYRKSFSSPQINFKLGNDNGQSLRFILETNMFQLEGLPNSAWRYYNDIFSDDLWHQITITVDQETGTWVVYFDGQEKYKQIFIQSLASDLNKLEITGSQGSALIDEIAIWDRPLLAVEVLNNYQANAPFSPINSRTEKLPAELSYFWDFQEGDSSAGIATEAVDGVSSSSLTVLPELWTWRAQHDSALISKWAKDLRVDFTEPLDSKDLSLSFWWRNSVYPEEGRTRVSLKYNNEEMLGLVANYFRPGYYFNRNYGIFTEGMNQSVPYDDKWHHLALTYDSYRYLLRFYVDGQEKASSSYFWIKDGEGPNRLEIKSELSSSEIDDLGVWTGTLTSQEINDIYTNNR